MLNLQHPLPSMSSALVSDIHKQHGGLPHLSQFRDFHWGGDGKECTKEGQQCSHTPPLMSNQRVYYNSGLRTPPGDPRDMTVNPLSTASNGGQHYQRVPVSGSSNPPLSNSRPALDKANPPATRQPFYDSYYSAKRPQSPILPKKDNAAQSEQTARRRASSDGNSIASHLQIPSSINNSKGSLPEFAAQVRIAFLILVIVLTATR